MCGAVQNAASMARFYYTYVSRETAFSSLYEQVDVGNAQAGMQREIKSVGKEL